MMFHLNHYLSIGPTNLLPLDKLIHYRIGIMMYKYADCVLSSVMNSVYTVVYLGFLNIHILCAGGD